MPDRAPERHRMVERQVAARGIRDPEVLDAMRDVPRERFVAPEVAHLAYEDRPLPIPEGQTISQPYMVALMLEAADLEPADRVLVSWENLGEGRTDVRVLIRLLRWARAPGTPRRS